MSHTVLNVNDDDAVRFIRSRILRNAGFDTLEAATVAGCLHLAVEKQPSLILLDVRLPDGNGFAACQRLKADPKTAWIPVLHISSIGRSEHQFPEARDCKAEGYLQEPVDAEVLITIVQALIRASEAEARARKAERDAAAALESVAEAVYVVDRQFRFTCVNAEAERGLGMGREDLIGKDHFKVLPDSVEASLRHEFEQVLARRRASSFEYFCEPRKTWFEMRASPAGDGGLAVSFRDITARKHALEQLAQSQELLTLAGQAGLLGTFVWWFDTDQVMISPEVYKLYGLDPAGAAAPARFWWDRVYPEDRVRMQDMFSECLASRRSFVTCEFRVVHPDQSEHWLLCRANFRYAADGKPRLMAGVNIDITERKRLEANLEQSNRDLLQFASIVSHDLQAPLNAVSTFSQWLSEQYSGQLDAQADRYLENIRSSVRRMKSFIQGLLEYSRAEAVSAMPTVEADCNDAMDRVLFTLQTQIQAARAVVTCDRLPTVRERERQMEQVFQNLLGNALKYRDAEREPRIHVSAVPHGDHWLFSVTDNGIGIDMSEADRIFKVFERLHVPSQYEGAGIGLAICKRIVERLGGRIWVESEPGKGSTFFFTVPARTGDLAPGVTLPDAAESGLSASPCH